MSNFVRFFRATPISSSIQKASFYSPIRDSIPDRLSTSKSTCLKMRSVLPQKNGQSHYWISFALRKGQRRPRNDPDGPDMDHPRRSSPAHIPWGPYGQLGWVEVTCACDPLPSRRPRTLKRARTGGSGRRLSGSLAGDSGDHHQYQRRGIVSCDDY